MQPMTTIQKWQIDQLENAINTLIYLVQTISDHDAKTLRDSGDGWTVLEVLGHLRDFEGVFLERAKLTLEQDSPDLPFPNPDTLAQEKRYNDDDMAQVLADWGASRQQYVALLKATESELWERPANHPTRGNFTLNDQVFLTVWHDMNHFEQITHIMLSKAS